LVDSDFNDPLMNLLEYLRPHRHAPAPYGLGVRHLATAYPREVAMDEIGAHFTLEYCIAPVADMLENQQSQEEVYLKEYADGGEARAGIGSWIAFYNGHRPHQALGDRPPMAVWRAGLTAPLGPNAVDMMDNARALPTSPQPQQQKQVTLSAA
jgi:Integrase core domain